MTEKETFMRAVTIVCDTREKGNGHIIKAFDDWKVKHENRKLDVGDYSFVITDRDFCLSCAIEHKSGVEEIYSNIMEADPGSKSKGGRLEKELEAGSRTINQFVLLIENCGSMEELKKYVVPEWSMKMCPQRKVADIGRLCYPHLKAWQQSNRYNTTIDFVKNPADTAGRIIETFYYYYRNYKRLIASRR